MAGGRGQGGDHMYSSSSPSSLNSRSQNGTTHDGRKGLDSERASDSSKSKHGNHGGRNTSVSVDKKQTDCYYGPWNASVAIEKKIGDRKDSPRTSLSGAGKHNSQRTSADIMKDRRQKARRNSIASVDSTSSHRLAEGSEETAHWVSSSSEEGRSSPRTTTHRFGYNGSPSGSVGSNHSETCSKDSVSWKRGQISSPESQSSCATGGDSPSCDSFYSKADSRTRYQQPSKLPRFPSSYSPQVLSASVHSGSTAAGANTSILAKNFLAKLKESTKAFAPPDVTEAPALPSWNASITAAPNLFDHSSNGSPALKMTRKTGAEEQIAENGESTTPPEGSVSIPPEETIPTVQEEMTVPIPENSAEKHIDPGSVVSVPSTPRSNLTGYAYDSMSDSATSTPSPIQLSNTANTEETEEESDVPATPEPEETRKNETFSLKRNATPERSLSEEYMTDHTLTTTIKRNIQGVRVKVLVHAFESLKTGPDAEHHFSADETMRS